MHTGIVKYGDTVTIKIATRNYIEKTLIFNFHEDVKVDNHTDEYSWYDVQDDQDMNTQIKITVDAEGNGETTFALPKSWESAHKKGKEGVPRYFYLKSGNLEFPQAYYVANPNKNQEANKQNKNRIKALMLKVAKNLTLDEATEKNNAVILGEEFVGVTKSKNGKCDMCASNITKAQLDTFMKNARHGSFSSSFADRFNYETYLNLYMKDFGYNDNCNRRAHFLGQIAKETKFWSYNESFNYTVAGFNSTFTDSAVNRRARAYARERAADPAVTYINQVKMANILYSRLSGESLNLADRNGGGYKFRGRGLIQLTGKGNYQEFQQWYNALRNSKPQYGLPVHDFMADVTATINSSAEELANRQGPNMLFEPKILVLSAIYYFEKKIPKAFLDKDPTEANVLAVTNKINPGEVTDKKKMRHDYVVAARNVFRNTSKCKLIENKPATNSKWREPVDNPQITIYTQGGKCRPWRSAFGNVRTDLRARDGVSPRPHHGLDLFTEIGTSVYACLPGKVVSLSPGTGYGLGFVFKIDDNYLEDFKNQRRNYSPYYVKSKRTYDSNKYDINGFGDFEEYDGITQSSSVYLMYAHLSEVLVTLNEEITIDIYKTKILGKSGDTGATGTKGPHLHFEIRSRLNPSGYSERYNPAFYVNYKNEEQLTTIERNIQDRTANN